MGVAIGALFGVFSLSMVAKTAVLAVTHLKVNKYKVITSLKITNLLVKRELKDLLLQTVK